LDNYSQEELRQECRFLCKSVLKLTPSPTALDRYVEAHEIVFAQMTKLPSSRFDSLVSEAVRRRQDIEALEYALRSKQEITILTKKLHLLLYIIETHPVHQTLFVNTRDSVLKGYVVLAYQIIRSSYKLFKGRMMLLLTPGTK
jgi:hypothetical protein